MRKPTKVTPTLAMQILQSQNFRCALTGRSLSPESAVLDHIVPLSREGEHAASNIWVIHRDVNQAKGRLLLEEFWAMCEQVIAHRLASEQMRQLATGGWVSPNKMEEHHES